MWREESVSEISDGKLYTGSDMVRIGTNDCAGCSDCCRMNPLIVLDPCDTFELQRFLGQSLEEMLDENIRLDVIDGLIFPVLKMDEKGECTFLREDGRCSIHDFRPGICRMYPLGRSWENGDFRYILQINECTHCTGAKMRVRKWLGIPGLDRYENFCRQWHHFLERVRSVLEAFDRAGAPDRHDQAGTMRGQDQAGTPGRQDRAGALRRQVCEGILRTFYFCPWGDDFYAEFETKLKEAGRRLGFAED